MKTIEDLKRLLKSIELCTQPIDGHTDPNSVDDCWLYVSDIIDDIEKSHKIEINKILELAADKAQFGYQSLNRDAILSLINTI